MDATLQTERIDASAAGLSVRAVRPRRDPPRFGFWWALLLLVSDLTMFVGSALLVVTVGRNGIATFYRRPDLFITICVVIATWLLLFRLNGLYRRSFSASFRDEIYGTVAGLLLGVAPELIIFTIIPAISPSRSFLLELFAVSAVTVGFARAFLHQIRTRVAFRTSRRVAIVGAASRVDAVVDELHLTSRDSVLRLALDNFDAVLNRSMERGTVADLPWLRGALEWQCDTLIVTEALPPKIMPALLRVTEGRGTKLAYAPTRIRPQAYDFRLEKDGGLALICPRSLPVCTQGAKLVRRLFNLGLVLPAMVVLAPVFAVVAVLVMLDSPGAAIFRQERVGKDGQTFEIIKFRTMPLDAEAATGPIWANPDRSRTTRVGKWLRRTSIDELPQLVNVLRGEMSLVGPRPERPYYVDRFRELLPRYDERHLVEPGITGWSQINMRRILDPSDAGEKLSYDLFYIEHWSLFLDASILVKTFAEFLFHRVA